MTKAGDLVKAALAKSKRPLSTYEVAKNAGISWSSTIMHCYRLKAEGSLDCKEEEGRTGAKKVIWWLKK